MRKLTTRDLFAITVLFAIWFAVSVKFLSPIGFGLMLVVPVTATLAFVLQRMWIFYGLPFWASTLFGIILVASKVTQLSSWNQSVLMLFVCYLTSVVFAVVQTLKKHSELDRVAVFSQGVINSGFGGLLAGLGLGGGFLLSLILSLVAGTWQGDAVSLTSDALGILFFAIFVPGFAGFFSGILAGPIAGLICAILTPGTSSTTLKPSDDKQPEA